MKIAENYRKREEVRLENMKLKECIRACSENDDLEDVQFELYRCLKELEK